MFKTSCLIAVLFALPVQAQPLTVEAFYDINSRVMNIAMAERMATVRVFDLSAPERLEEKLSEGLSTDPDQAERQAQARIANGGHELQKQLVDAYEGSLKAMQYKIEKLPAIVFNNGDHVIYGVEDVHRAISIYNEKKGE